MTVDPNTVAPDQRFRILALDGGGVRGAFSAAVLAELESATRSTCASSFDLIAGTSTGGLLAIGLALGIPAADLRDFYIEHGPKIFSYEGRWGTLRGAVKQLFGSKYDARPLELALTQVFGERRFGDARTRLVIPAYDITNGRVFVFKTCHDPRFTFDVEASAVEIALCTSAAPTYFPAKALPIHAGSAYTDGGVWANAPALVGIVEAVAFLGRSPSELEVLSIGTTSALPNFAEHGDRGVIGWNRKLVEIFMTGQVQGTEAMAGLLCPDGSFHRINATVQRSWTKMDSMSKVDQLIAAGVAEARKRAHLDVVRDRFLTGVPVEPFATG